MRGIGELRGGVIAPNDDVGDDVVPHSQLESDLRLRPVLIQTRQSAEILGGNRGRVFLADKCVRVCRVAWVWVLWVRVKTTV